MLITSNQKFLRIATALNSFLKSLYFNRLKAFYRQAHFFVFLSLVTIAQ